jgi:hypothetical protein
MSNISNRRDGHLMQKTENQNASMLPASTVSCWETWRWELTKTAVQAAQRVSKTTSSDYRSTE